MARARSRRARRSDSDHWKKAGGIVLVASVVLALAYGSYLFVVTRAAHVDLDRETFCPAAGPQAITTVIVDTTDPLTLVQRTDLVNELQKVIETVPRYGSLELYAVRPVETDAPQPIFRKCNPGRAAEINPLFGNPEMVERQWRDGFREPLEKVLQAILVPTGAESSPILESIQWVAVNSLTGPGRSNTPRSLLIASDMLQHTSGMSLYRGPPEFKTFEKTPYYRRVRAPLDGVAVSLLMLRRDTRAGAQGQPLIRFWTSYFDAQGVRSLRIVNLAG